MASLVLRNGTYYAQWHDASRRPLRRRHSLRTSDRHSAQILLNEAENAYRLRSWDPWVDPISVLDARPAEPIRLGAAVEQYLTARKRRLQPVTLSNYRSLLNRFAKNVGEDALLARLKPSLIEAFACDPAVQPSTQQTRLIVMRAFCSWAVREGHLDENVARRVETPTVPARLPRSVSREELERVLSAIREDQQRRDSSTDSRLHTDRLWLIATFRFAFYTGLRASELSRMTWGDVDLAKGRIRLLIQKNKQAQILPLSARARGVLDDLDPLAPDDYVFCPPCSRGERRTIRAFSTNLNAYFRDYVELAGIERKLTLHGLRHGFCTYLAESGANAFAVQAAARHANVSTSQRYVSMSDTTLQEALDEAFGTPG